MFIELSHIIINLLVELRIKYKNSFAFYHCCWYHLLFFNYKVCDSEICVGENNKIIKKNYSGLVLQIFLFNRNYNWVSSAVKNTQSSFSVGKTIIKNLKFFAGRKYYGEKEMEVLKNHRRKSNHQATLCCYS